MRKAPSTWPELFEWCRSGMATPEMILWNYEHVSQFDTTDDAAKWLAEQEKPIAQDILRGAEQVSQGAKVESLGLPPLVEECLTERLLTVSFLAAAVLAESRAVTSFPDTPFPNLAMSLLTGDWWETNGRFRAVENIVLQSWEGLKRNERHYGPDL